MLSRRGDDISCLPYASEALKVSFIIDVQGAGLGAALLLLSIIHLLSTEQTAICKPSYQTWNQLKSYQHGVFA